MHWDNIPWELKERSQWCLAAPAGLYSVKGKEPLYVDHNGKIQFASSVAPSTWMTYDAAMFWALSKGWHIGYMMSEDDPYTCIDFDVKDAQNAPDKPETWTTREEMEVFYSYLRSFDTYTEWSASGKGFHAWVRGKIGRGVHVRGIEIYSQERFMITTGNVVNTKAIEYRQDMLTSFAEHIRPKGIIEGIALEEIPEIHDDWYIDKIALAAENRDKFLQLWSSDESNYDQIMTETPRYDYVEGVGRVHVGVDTKQAYPSQSEADLALMSMYTFYSPSNEQCRRLFRNSGLGKREKAQKDDRYLNYTLRVIRSRQYNETQSEVKGAIAAMLTKNEIVQAEVQRLQQMNDNPTEVHPIHMPGQPVPVQQLPNTAAALARAAPVTAAVAQAASDGGIPWPPGVMGRIAHFVYQSSYLSVKEVAIVTAIGLMAGLAGKGWHVTQSGLNQYVTLIGRSAIGKEGMHSGMSLLVKAVSKVNPSFANFVCFDDFASGPALTKYAATCSSFVNISGEWGHKLKRMANAEAGRDQAIATLRQQMTNLYQKSGPQNIVGGIKYSDKDKNITSVSGVAYSMIGETTPGTFYEALTEDMMADGFLSRFIAIEHTGLRPEANPNMVLVPDSALIEVLSNICTTAGRVATFMAPSMPVGRDEAAATIMYAFERECRDEINKSSSEPFRQMWNRAALKSTRLAALLAVADHHLFPVINVEHITWAIDVIRRDIQIFKSRIEDGDVGITDASRQRKLMSVIRHYIVAPLPAGKIGMQKFKDNNVVTRSYLQVYCAQSIAFNKFRGGATQALNLTLQSFLDLGYLAEVDRGKAVKDYNFSGKCYRILDIPAMKLGED